jgi:hypothetical protein
MSLSTLRNAFVWNLVFALPASMFAADSAAAMLYAKGTAWLNGSSVPKTSAVFPGDLVQTKPDSVVNINASGSSVIILSDSLVKYEGGSVAIEHGTVTVATSKGMTTRAGEITVSPASNAALTEFEVSDLDGTVLIVARKGDLSVSDGTETSRLAQGDQATRDDSQSDENKKKKRRRGAGAAPAAGGGVLDSPLAMKIGAVAVFGLGAWVLLQDDEPASPSKPN